VALPDIVQEQLYELLQGSDDAINSLSKAYLDDFAEIDKQIKDVLLEPNKTKVTEKLPYLRKEIVGRLRSLAGDTAGVVEMAKKAGFDAGMQSGLENILDALDSPGVPGHISKVEKTAVFTAGFGKPNPNAYAAYNAAVADKDSPLKELFDKMPGGTGQAIIQKLRMAILQQQNPLVTMRKIRGLLDGNRRRAMTIARTEQLRASRAASQATYQQSKVVVKWMWNSALDRRSCYACISLHGTIWNKEESQHTHPNCRCSMVPVTKTWAEMGVKGVPETGVGHDGVDAYIDGFPGVSVSKSEREKAVAHINSLSPKEQTALMGQAFVKAKVGEANPHLQMERDIAFYPDPKWGGSFAQKTLVGKFGTEKAAELSPTIAKHVDIYSAKNAAYLQKKAEDLPKIEAAKDALVQKKLAVYAAAQAKKTAPLTYAKASTGKPKPGTPEFKAKVSEAVKAANAKKAAVKAAEAEAAQAKVKDAGADAVAAKAVMAAKVGHGVKVANAKKAGNPLPAPPDYDAIKAQAKADFLAGKVVVKPPKAPKEPVAPKALVVPEAPKVKQKAGWEMDPVKVEQLLMGPIAPPLPKPFDIVETVQYTGTLFTYQISSASKKVFLAGGDLSYKPNKPPSAFPGTYAFVKLNNATFVALSRYKEIRNEARQAIIEKISKATAKGKMDSAHRLTKILSQGPSSTIAIKYYGMYAAKKYGVDGYISVIHSTAASMAHLTNPKLVKQATLFDTANTPAGNAAKAAQAAALRKTRQLGAAKLAERESSSGFSPITPDSPEWKSANAKSATFLRKPIRSIGGVSPDAAVQAKKSIAEDLASRLAGNAVWDDFVDRLAKDTQYNLSAFPGTTRHEQATTMLVQRWAVSSFDHHSRMIAIQRAAIDEFGLADDGFNNRVRQLGNKTYSEFERDVTENGPAFRLFLREMYNHTQEQFAAAKVTHIAIARGQGINRDIIPEAYNNPNFDSALYNLPSGDFDVNWQPMSSWSTSISVAKGFSHGENGGGVFYAYIPVDRVIGTCRTGFGCLNEYEMVVMDTSGKVFFQPNKKVSD